ncbi:hypothetical protein [Halobacillus dabanensis]|uniref:hypothetical protein n=1 Tax=Halobacillus dabanensis TaxID=240302 RepID=UPI001428928A|nr:hypothetical protein [Halobacillus dabanensis]
MSYSKSPKNNPAISRGRIALQACDYRTFTYIMPLLLLEDGFEILIMERGGGKR